MEKQQLREFWETLEGEYYKTTAEIALSSLARYRVGQSILEHMAGERIEDKRLKTTMAGIEFENPVMVGAGWDKKGRCIDGFYSLGFAGEEVGTILIFPQLGNPKPRLFTDKETHSVGFNRLGFNAPGVEVVENYLRGQERRGVVGISVGKNKLLPDELAPWAHAEVVRRLYGYGDYFVINVSSPNTPGLRNQLQPDPLTDNIRAVKAVLFELGTKPLFIKTTVDLSLEDLDKVLEVCLREDVDGIIDTNTTVDEQIKTRYGWRGQMGGVSGNDTEFRRRATERMKYITRTTEGTGLVRVGAGGVTDGSCAVERIRAGAEIIQVVTAVRQYKTKTARNIKQGILYELDRLDLNSIQELVGMDA